MAETSNIFHFLKYPSQINHTCSEHHTPPHHDSTNTQTTITTTTNNNNTPQNNHFPSKKQKTTPSNNDETPKVFQCQFCPRKFASYKALGGHQNAHKRERAAARAAASHPQLSLSSSSTFGYGLYCCGYDQNGRYFGNIVNKSDDKNGGYFGNVGGGGFLVGFGQGVSLSPSHQVMNINEDGGADHPTDLNLDLTIGTF